MPTGAVRWSGSTASSISTWCCNCGNGGFRRAVAAAEASPASLQPEQFGLTEERVHEELGDYVRRFAVPREGRAAADPPLGQIERGLVPSRAAGYRNPTADPPFVLQRRFDMIGKIIGAFVGDKLATNEVAWGATGAGTRRGSNLAHRAVEPAKHADPGGRLCRQALFRVE